jgi:hypothetical protein
MALLSHAVLDISKGCHTGSFFTGEESPTLGFLSGYLTT